MKYILYIFLVAIFFVSCKKNTTLNSQNILVGKWQVINDSSTITGSLNGFNDSSNYIGTSSDYYNFTSKGNLFVQEGQSVDTAQYELSNNSNQVYILYSYIAGNYISGNAAESFNISNLTTTHVTLTSSGLTPEGYFYRAINLKK